MNYSGDMRWALWAMVAHGLGDSRSGTGGQTGSTDSSSSSRSDGSGGRSSGGGIGPGGSGASDPSGGRSGGSSSSSSSSGKSTGNSSSGKSSSSNSNSSGGKSAGNGSDGKDSSKSSSSARGSVGGDGPATGKSTSNSTAGKSTASRSSSGLGDRDGGGYGGTSVGRQSSSSSRSSGKSTLTASQESNLAGRLSGAVDAGTGRSLNEADSGKTGRIGGGLSPAQNANLSDRLGGSSAKSTLSAAQEANLAGRLGGTTTTAADKTGLTPAQDRNLSDRLGDIRTGKNLMAPALEANVADRLGSPTARTATGFATSARAAEDMSMGALREEQAKSAKNYGLGFASLQRAAEDRSMTKQRAIEDALSFISNKEAQRAINPATGKVDPYNGLVGGRRSPTHADLENMTIAEVQDYQKGMMSRGHLSTAVGKYQMLAGTLADQVKRSNMDPNTTRFTKSVQDELAVGLLDNRAKQAMVNGVVDPEKFANRLAAEWASFQQSNGRGRYDRDGINTATVPYSSVLETATELSSTGAINGVTSARGSKGGRVETANNDLPVSGPMPSGRPGPTPTSRSSALASTMNISADVRTAAERRGVDPVAVAEYAARYGMDAETAAFAVTPQNQVAGYRDPDARTIAGAPAVYSPPSQGDIAQPVETVAAPAQPSAAPAPSRERFATKYLGAPPGNVPTPTSRPNALANEAPATAAVPAERSLPDKVLAGAIDAGVGMIPGVGMAAGVYGLAAPMLGLPTIGDAALAVRDTNQFDLKESLRNPSREGDGNDGTGLTAADGATLRQAAGAPSTTVAGFESKYLAWRDPTPRPTPEERWGAAGSTGGMRYGA